MSDATLPQAPRPAATMIVLREQHGEIEVLMSQRHANLAFMGGMWVFPGGTLALADQSEAALKLLNAPRCEFTLDALNGAQLPHETCMALVIAACRETFEETGVLLARRSDDSPIETGQLARLHAERAILATDPALFVPALLREHLRLDAESIVYWAHWITPSAVARRFDTRFFVTRAPAAHEHIADTYETAECIWMTPRELLEKARCGAMKIAQPTRYNLEVLCASIATHGTLDTLLGEEAQREVAPIMPKLLDDDGKTMIVMPWDPQYSQVPGEGVQPGQRYDPALLTLASRIERDH